MTSRAPRPPAPEPGAGRRRLLGLARVVVGLALLVLVGRTLPWSDELVWRRGTDEVEETLVVPGRIVGDWKSDRIAFDPGPAELPPGWPEPVRAAAEEGGAVALERTGEPDAALGGAFDWRPGMPRAFREMERGGLALAATLFVTAMGFAVTRWWRLLRVVGCRTSWLDTWRLTLLGMFFNLVVPGLTGGDVVKAVIVARENPGRRADALVSVAVDRIIGLVALAAIAMGMILVAGSTFAELRAPVLLFLVAGLAGVLVYYNRPLRRAVRFDRLLERLPLGRRLRDLDEAVLTYGRHPAEVAGAFGLSLVNHVLVTLGFVALGAAFGVGFDEIPLAEWFVVVPIGNMVTALPLAPGGWGLGEYAFKVLFEMVGASGAMGVAVSVTFRLTMLALGLAGGLFLLVPGQRAALEELDERDAPARPSPPEPARSRS